MSHGVALNIDIEKAMDAEPISFGSILLLVAKLLVVVGVVAFLGALFAGYPRDLLWGMYYSALTFWMGLAAGGVIVTAIVQIVRAKWIAPIRRLAEANVEFLPYAWVFVMLTWFGKDSLFSWGRAPMPGREWWMQPGFVYLRFGLLLAFLFFMMRRFVRMSLRSDIGVLRERSEESKSKWSGLFYKGLSAGWRGSDVEVKDIQRRLSWNAPLLILIYVVIYSLFGFEMIMGMNSIWYSNLFGAFMFIGNVYLGWAVLGMLTVYACQNNREFSGHVDSQQLWDVAKLTFGFCMIWGYFFFSQFLPQWYGNLPEETQWMILRTREYPWKPLGYITFAMCFVMPFIMLLSRDLKRTPKALFLTGVIILLGVFLEKYMIIMPELSPERVPLFNGGEFLLQAALFLGFFGVWVLSVASFMKKVPAIPFSHPIASGSIDW